MKILSDFECSGCGNTFERLVDSEVRVGVCPLCFASTYRRISAPTVRLEGITGAFPGAHDHWAKIREDHAKIKARKNAQ
jgi:hypothetical protein